MLNTITLGSNSLGYAEAVTFYSTTHISFSLDVPFINGTYSQNCNSMTAVNITRAGIKADETSSYLAGLFGWCSR